MRTGSEAYVLDLAGRRVMLALLLCDPISRLAPAASWATCAGGPDTRHVLLLGSLRVVEPLTDNALSRRVWLDALSAKLS